MSAALQVGSFVAAQVAGVADARVQDNLLQARQAQALSFAFHIVIVCFGVAFPAFVLIVEGLWLRTGEPAYLALAKRWSKVMVILFAVGVVSGTILSFEMGLLWPAFMSRFGEVFGFAFALEGIAFFVEAIFLAIYVYGWDRIPDRLHLLSGVPVVVAGVMGSLFVLSVNGWMNNPSGFTLRDGEVTDVRPLAALFNGNLPQELVHMTLAGYMVAGFLTASVYAWAWMRGRRDRYHRAALLVPLTVACLVAPVQVVVGDWVGRRVADVQPTKLAAIEGLGSTTSGAALTLGGWYTDGAVRWGVEVPRGLSVLARRDPDATIQGLDAVPPDDRPPVNVVRIAFQAMVSIGSALALFAVWVLATLWRRRRPPRSVWFARAAVAAGPLSVVALVAGWTVTEVGRQPWVVYRIMRTEEAVTRAAGIPLALAVLAVTYVALAAGAVWALRLLARTPPDVSARPGPHTRTPVALP